MVCVEGCGMYVVECGVLWIVWCVVESGVMWRVWCDVKSVVWCVVKGVVCMLWSVACCG